MSADEPAEKMKRKDYEKELAQMLSPRDASIAVAKTATPRVQ